MNQQTFPISEVSRVKGALYGLMVGDALAMPAHWYYNRNALKRDYGHIIDYLPPRNPHPDSILWRSHYKPKNPRFDILHDQAQFWGQSGIHYHQFLKAGENTLNLKLCQLLMQSLTENNGYNPDHYLERYITFMTTPGSHSDTYVEEYHRHFFNQLGAGHSPHKCSVPEKHIGGLVGLVPLIVFYRDDKQRAIEAAQKHLSLTHRGERMEKAADFLIDTLWRLLQEEPIETIFTSGMKSQASPFFGHPFMKWHRMQDDVVIGRYLSTACYVEDALPAVIFLASKYARNTEEALIANTNLGGDNAHRGGILGALLGAANGVRSFPKRWITGIKNAPRLQRLITNIAKAPTN